MTVIPSVPAHAKMLSAMHRHGKTNDAQRGQMIPWKGDPGVGVLAQKISPSLLASLDLKRDADV
jgi:hypothetical protein